MQIDDFNEKTFSIIDKKTILEIGCSDGAMASKYATYCNKFVGVDISDAGIAHANARNLANGTFKVCDAHQLPFETKTFDVVIVNSLLHHLDLKVALGEISRVLKTKGQLCVREPLGTNPVIALYRYYTPKARTVDERPFTRSDVRGC